MEGPLYKIQTDKVFILLNLYCGGDTYKGTIGGKKNINRIIQMVIGLDAGVL